MRVNDRTRTGDHLDHNQEKGDLIGLISLVYAVSDGLRSIHFRSI